MDLSSGAIPKVSVCIDEWQMIVIWFAYRHPYFLANDTRKSNGYLRLCPKMAWRPDEWFCSWSSTKEAGCHETTRSRGRVLPAFQWQSSRGLRLSLPQKNRIRVL
jgi:hypothetical protein